MHVIPSGPRPARQRRRASRAGIRRPAWGACLRAAAPAAAPRPRRRRRLAPRPERSGRPCSVRQRRAQNPDALALAFAVGQVEPGAGNGRQPAHMVVDLACGPRESRCPFRPCRSWRHRWRPRPVAARSPMRPAPAGPARAPSGRRRVPPADRGVRRRSCPARWTGVRARQTGPVSSPSSIRITVAAVSVSPAMMARWIGAAPRQRGRADACRFRQPSRGASRTGFGRIRP